MNYLGVILLFVVVSCVSSQFKYSSPTLKKLTSTFDKPKSNYYRGQNRYQYNPNNDQYNQRSNNDYSSRYNGQYNSQESGKYYDNSGSYASYDNSGQYVPDDSGRYVHVDNKYLHADVAGLGYKHQDGGIEGYRHQDGNIEKYRPDHSSDGYKGNSDKYDLDGYKGDYEKYKGDGGYEGYNDKFDGDGYKGNKDKQVPYVPYVENNNAGLDGPSKNRNNKVSRPNARNLGIDGNGIQGADSNKVNKFSGIGDGRRNAGFGDGGVLNKGGNADSRLNADVKHRSDKCDYNSPRNFKIIRQKSDLGIDQYHYLYETENCMYKEETGAHVKVNNEETLRAEGIYYYVAPNNVKYTTTYTADERGYLPQGDHIPEMPPLILKGLQYLKSIGKL